MSVASSDSVAHDGV